MVALVVLRLSIGWHFLYEGVWKIAHSDEFSARPFLTQAKGPTAPLFYSMVPDLDGGERLWIETGEEGQQVVSAPAYLTCWYDLKQQVVDKYQLGQEQEQAAEALYQSYAESVAEYLADNRDAMIGYFGSLDRFEQQKAAGNNGTAFQQKRMWDRQQELRREVGVWLGELDQMGEDFRLALWDLLEDDQKAVGMIPAAVPEPDRLPVKLPVVNSRTQLLDFGVTYGLTAIGFCLIAGLFTRLASLAGVAFLVSVLLSQPPWPTIYPPAPEVVGHALVVDKNFVEMVALLVLASTAAGRWGGLDFFVHHWLVRPLVSRSRQDSKQKAESE